MQDIFPVKLENELFNEYTENHEMLSMVFPYIFPFGLREDIYKKKGVPPEKLRKSWFQFYDRRCAEEIDLIFLMFDQALRHERNKQVAFQIKKNGKREQEFIKLCNDSDFRQRLEKAVEHPNGKFAKEVKKLINPLIKITERKISWSPLERADTLGKLYSLMHFFNIGTHFITISPCMRHHALAIRITYTDKAGKQWEIPDLEIRTKAITKNPIAATQTFYRLIEKFFEIIVGISVTHNTNYKMLFDRILAKNKDKYIGPYGRITAALGIIEEQTGGSLHYHGILFGGWDIDVFRQHIHKPEVAKKIAELIDSQITCEIPEELQKTYPVPIEKRRVFASEPYPKAENIKTEAAEIAMNLAHHTHSFSCYKDNNINCRMAMPQPWAPETYWTEIHCDPVTNKPARKFKGSCHENEIISAPPDYPENGNPFQIEDKRNIVCGLKAANKFDQLQPPHNPLSTVCLKCNTCMYVLAAPSQAKTAYYYICKYCSKHPYEIKRILPLLLQSTIEKEKYGSKAEDNGAPTRVSKLVLQKTQHKAGLMEASDQQCAALAMGRKSYFSTHEFRFVPIIEAVEHYRKSQKNEEQSDSDSDSDSDTESKEESKDEFNDNPTRAELNCEFDTAQYDDDYNLNLATAVDTGDAFAIAKLDKYLNRGKELENLCLYLYTAIIACSKLDTIKKQKQNQKSAGRPAHRKFPFAPNSKPAKAFIQHIANGAYIPRLTGGAPPKYPGEPPNENDFKDKFKDDFREEFEKEFYKWSKEAENFAVYYSMLFLPLNEHGLPFEPTQPDISILPWKTENAESWGNFWKIFGSWNVPTGNNPTTKLYKRTMWQIFKNMVENLRQGAGDRRLLRDWRFQEAEPRPTTLAYTRSSTVSYENQYDINITEALEEWMRAEWSEEKSRAEKEINKANDYLKQQIKAIQEIDEYAKYKTEKKPFDKFNMKKCKEIEKKLKAEEEKNMDIDEQIKVYPVHFKSYKLNKHFKLYLAKLWISSN